MNKVKKGLDNQALGLLPLLLFMLLDSYISYLISFVIGFTFSIGSLFLFHILSKKKVYQFTLLPVAATLAIYSAILCLKLDPILFIYSPVIVEVLFVVILAVSGFFKRLVLQRIRDSKHPTYRRTFLRTTLNEFYFVSQIVQNLYTLHLFIILFYSILPDEMQSAGVERFLYRDLVLVLGGIVIVYEQIRLLLMRGSLRKEMWLPVLADDGKVIGCIARSVSRTVSKKYYHPVVRMAVVYKGMLYLVKRGKDAFVSPDLLDYPFLSYVLFRHSIDSTVKETVSCLNKEKGVNPRFLLRYTFENDKVKHLVSLYVVCLQTEEQLELCTHKQGKLWTSKQIQENLGSGVFSEAFEKEFPYLQNTILLAENFCCDHTNQTASMPLVADAGTSI